MFILALLVLLIVISSRGRKDKKKDLRKKKPNKSRDQLMKEATRKLTQNPKDTGALAILADLYYGDSNWEKARIAYASLVEAANNSNNADLDEFEVNLRHGICCLNLKQPEEAYHSLSVARAIKPEIFEVNYHLGTLEYQRKGYERAMSMLAMAQDAQPDHLDTRKYLGLSLFRLKKYKEAIDKLKTVIDQHMDDKEAIYYLAHAYFENGQLEMAAQLFSHLRPDPGFGPQAAVMAGSIHMKQKQYDEAQLDFEIGLKHPNIKKEVLLELHYRLSSTLMKKQEIAEAVRHLKTIHEIDPGYKDVAAQIAASQELSQNEHLQTFLLGAPSDFVSLCRRLSAAFFPKSRTKVIDIYVEKGDYADILAEVETPGWEDLILFRYVRSTGQIGEFIMRDLHTKLKDLKAGRGFCICAGSFNETAYKFVEARSIDLVDKEGLLKAINKLGKQGI